MKIFLEKNWSEQFIYGDEIHPGFFVGRDKEKQNLKNIILSNSSSSVLVSSVRGVGKTSFIHKSLSEIKDKIHPIFVNIDHVFSTEEPSNIKKNILISLIRATYSSFEEKPNDKRKEEIRDLYEKSIGSYKEEEHVDNSIEKRKETSRKFSFDLDIVSTIKYLSIGLLGYGVALDTILSKTLGLLGLGLFAFSFSLKKETIVTLTDNFFKKKTAFRDNTSDYLELEFEKWLKKYQRKEKLVFVIDELDKVESKDSLACIKEYKNLFTRSFAHFIFIADQNSYNLIGLDRESSVDDGGIYPTLFTHVFYLSYPSTEDIRKYFKNIFKIEKKYSKKEIDELMNYLIISSKGDFFELKRIISDILLFNTKNKPFIDTEILRETNPYYSDIAKLFEYVDHYFLNRYVRKIKKYWRDNYELQKDTLTNINNSFGSNFSFINLKGTQLNKTILVDFLEDIGIIEKTGQELQTSNGKENEYRWTFQYKRDPSGQLLEIDKKYQLIFNRLIKTANDLENINSKSFDKNKLTVTDKADGSKFSGINLFSIYNANLKLFNNISDDSKRICVTTDELQKSLDNIEEQLNNVENKYFDIFRAALNEKFKENSNIFKEKAITSTEFNINGILGQFSELMSTIPNAYEHAIYGTVEPNKFVLLIKNFEDEKFIKTDLKNIKNIKNLKIINLIWGTNNKKIITPTFVSNKKKINIDNFKKINIDSFKELPNIIDEIESFLT